MNLVNKKIFFVILAILFIIIVGVNYRWKLIGFYKINKLIHACLSDQQNQLDQESCISKGLLKEVSQNPQLAGVLLDNLGRSLSLNGSTIDRRSFSELSHEVGMMLVDKKLSLEEAIQVCGVGFKQACIHGAIMQYIEENISPASPDKLFALCEHSMVQNNHSPNWVGYNCLHSVGHELTAKYSDPINTLLEFCKNSDISAQNACASGVFMEYTTGEQGLGRHSHKPVNSKAIPCELVLENFQAVCYASAASYKQYYPDSEPIEQTFKFCDQLQEVKNKQACRIGLEDRLLLITQ